MTNVKPELEKESYHFKKLTMNSSVAYRVITAIILYLRANNIDG
jgi:hypothetical protein